MLFLEMQNALIFLNAFRPAALFPRELSTRRQVVVLQIFLRSFHSTDRLIKEI